MASDNPLVRSFQADVNELAGLLIQQFGLRHSGEVVHLSDPLLRWMDFVARYISPRPRRIVTSSLFPKRLPAHIEAALSNLERLLIEGHDVNAYQTQGLTFRNDTSAAKRQRRTDLLWADWGIHHLHLVSAPVRARAPYSDRSGWLLFCRFHDDEVGFIDVRRHGKNEDFADPTLVQQMIHDWPDYMEQYRLKGMLPSREKLDAEAIHRLRRSGVAAPVTYGPSAFIGPGLGVTSASTPLRLTITCDRIRSGVAALAGLVSDPDGQFQAVVRERGTEAPIFRLLLTPAGLSVYEERSLVAFPLPRGAERSMTVLCDLHDTVLPQWALERVLSDFKESTVTN